MSTDFRPLEIPPGVMAMPTKNMRSSNWAEVNAVRWVEGKMQPIGGQSIQAITFASPCRAVHQWEDLAGNNYTAYLCEQHVYVDNRVTLLDISPASPLAPPTGIGTGFGAGHFGRGHFGHHPRPGAGFSGIEALPDAWSIYNFGAYLLVQTSPDQRLLMWDPAAPGTPLTRVTNSPLGRCFVVTQEEFVMMFGMLDGTGGGAANRFGWCDQGNLTDWTFASVVSKAGYLDIQPSSPIVTATAGKFGVLFFTSHHAYLAQFVGLPYVYDKRELGEASTPWSAASVRETILGAKLWMAQAGMFAFDGTTINPVPCNVRTWINDNVDTVNVRWTAASCHVGRFNEFWWMFPAKGSKYPNLAVIYNYKEGWWSQVRMTRSAGLDSSYTNRPIFADQMTAYVHENGQVYNGVDLPWAETFDINIASGGRLTTFKQAMIDFDGDETQVQYRLYFRFNRLSSISESMTDPIQIRMDGYVDFRVTGRDMRLRIEVKGPEVPPFSLGQHLVDFTPRGDR